MYQHGALTLFHVKGVPVRAHWTLLLLLAYLAVMFSGQFERVTGMAGVAPEELRAPALVWGVLLALALFVSIALHELAHTLVAIARGGRVRDITLMLLGGVSHFERIPERPGTEALVAVVGPATSLGLAGVLFTLLHAIGPASADLRLGISYLSYLNLVLGGFNLLPAFPMDGGRVLRALLAIRLGPARATVIAATIGMAVAVGMGVVGLWSGSFILVLIAVFVFFGARTETQTGQIQDALSGLRLADLLLEQPPTVILDTNLAEALSVMQRIGRPTLLVLDADSRLCGVVRAADVSEFSASDRPHIMVRALGDRLRSGVVTIPAGASAVSALQTAVQAQADQLLVVGAIGGEGDAPVRLLSLRVLEEAIRRRLAQSTSPSQRVPMQRRST